MSSGIRCWPEDYTSMVVYELVSQEGESCIYVYWPELDAEADPGYFFCDSETGETELLHPAQEDFISRTTGAAMNRMRDAINEMRAENGEPLLTEEELPTMPKDAVYECWVYYDKAQSDLARRIKEGRSTERGTVIWY